MTQDPTSLLGSDTALPGQIQEADDPTETAPDLDQPAVVLLDEAW